MAVQVFIDGGEGTTGLRLAGRLQARRDVRLITIPDEVRKDPSARAERINDSDVTFLCLPDGAAKEAVTLVKNERVKIIDASTAHRTAEGWAYGLPELDTEHREKIIASRRTAVPGCHASGFIALVYPLVRAGLVAPDYPFSCHSLTGYSGGGKQMIAEYEAAGREAWLSLPRAYGLSGQHKHLKEMMAVPRLDYAPAFQPVVDDFYSGMEVSVPLFPRYMKRPMKPHEISAFYAEWYASSAVITACPLPIGAGFLSAHEHAGKDDMHIVVSGNAEGMLLTALYDNLGKGASGAAVQCFNLMCGCNETEGLLL